MKKLLAALLFCLLASGLLYAQSNVPTTGVPFAGPLLSTDQLLGNRGGHTKLFSPVNVTPPGSAGQYIINLDGTNYGAVDGSNASGLIDPRNYGAICPGPGYTGGLTSNVQGTLITSGGTGYANGTYNAVPLTGGTGTGAQATITVSGTKVTAVTITNAGSGYSLRDSLSANAANVGGTGTGFLVQVAHLSANRTPVYDGVHDSTAAFEAAFAAAQNTGQGVLVPNGCWVAPTSNSLDIPQGAVMVGEGYAATYGYNMLGGTASGMPVLYIIGHPTYAIKFGKSPNNAFVGFEVNASADGAAFSQTNCIGTDVNGGGGDTPVWMHFMAVRGCNHGFGSSDDSVTYFLHSDHSDYSANNYGIYGHAADLETISDTFASINNAGIKFTGFGGQARVNDDRFEFLTTAIDLSQYSGIVISNTNFDHASSTAIRLGSTSSDVFISNSSFQASGVSSSDTCSPSSGNEAHITLSKTTTGGANLHLSNTVFTTGGTCGPKYALEVTTTGSYNDYIYIDGGSTTSGYATDFYNFANGRPDHVTTELRGQATQGKLANGKFASQASGLPANQWTGYYAIGDVTANNNQLIPTTEAYPYLVARALGTGATVYTNNDFSHTGDCDLVNAKIFSNINSGGSNNPLITWQSGLGDPGWGAGFYSSHRIDTNSCRLAGLTWMAVPAENKVNGQDSGCVKTGSWSNNAAYSGVYGVTSSTNGDSLGCTTTTYGGPIYLWYQMMASNGGAFTWSLDGTTTGAVTTQGQNSFIFPNAATGSIQAGSIVTSGSGYVSATYPGVTLTGGSGSGALASITVAGTAVTALTVSTTNRGTNYKSGDVLSAAAASLGGTGAGFTWKATGVGTTTVGAVRIPVSTSGSHTVTSTLTSTTSGANTVTILGIGTPPNKTLAEMPTVFYGNQVPDVTQTAATAAFTADQLTQTALLFADGLNVNLARVQDYINTSTDFGVNGFGGLNNLGQSHIADAFKAAIEPSRSSGLAIDPRDYGASCNSIYFGASYATGGHESLVSTTSGSPVISVSRYKFQPGTATARGGGDVGKRFCIGPGTGSGRDVGPCSCVISVNTTTNTATLSRNAQDTVTAGYGVMGGYPTNFNDPTTCADDTIPIQNAGNAALAGGGKVFLPSNCMVHNLTMPQNITVEGSSPGQFYLSGATGLDDPLQQPTILNCGITGFSSDTPQCVQTVAHTLFKNLLIRGPVYPYTPYKISAACLGYSTASGSGPGAQTLTSHLSFFGCPVSIGQAYGYNYQVNFTAGIADNGDGTSTMTVASIDSTNFSTADDWSATDFLALNRTVSGPGVTVGTTITSVPAGSTTGTYTLNKAMTVTSTGLISPRGTQVLEVRDEFSQHIVDGIAYNGDFTDSMITGSVCTGTFMNTCYRLGPLVNGAGNGSIRIVGGRVEEMQGKYGAIICDGCGLDITGLDMQFNKYYNIKTMGSGSTISYTGGHMYAGGHCNLTATQDKAQIQLAGTNPHVDVTGVTLTTNDFGSGCGGTTTYLFSTATGATGVTASVTGGNTINGETITNLYNWTNGAPSKYRQNVAGWPEVDTFVVGTRTGLTLTTSYGGISSAGGLTSTATSGGTFTISALPAATNSWNCTGGNVTTGIEFAMSATTSTSCALKVTTTPGDQVWWMGKPN